MKYSLFFLFFFLCSIFVWGQSYKRCDSLFFVDGTTAVVNDLKVVEKGFRYHRCGEKYGPFYEVKMADLKRIRYRSGAQEFWYSENKSLAKVEISMVSEDIDTTQTWHVETLDGNDYYGNILKKEENYCVFRAFDIGAISIPYERIERMSLKALPRRVGDKYWSANPHATRYFLGSSAYGLKEGEGYYSNTWIMLNQVNYGLSNRYSFGFGTVPLFLFGEGIFPISIMPKISFPLGRSKWHGAVSVVYLNAFGEDASESNGITATYGALTYGSTDQNLTISLGHGLNDGQWFKTPILSFSAMDRFGRKSYLITENYLVTIEGSLSLICSIGGRWVGKYIAVDYGAVRPFFGIFSGTGFYFLPWLNITAPF